MTAFMRMDEFENREVIYFAPAPIYDCYIVPYLPTKSLTVPTIPRSCLYLVPRPINADQHRQPSARRQLAPKLGGKFVGFLINQGREQRKGLLRSPPWTTARRSVGILLGRDRWRLCTGCTNQSTLIVTCGSPLKSLKKTHISKIFV